MDAKMQKPRVLISNIFFAPSSFGGATIVAEHMAVLLKGLGWDVVVLTSIQDPEMIPYMTRRYQAKGLDIIGVKLPDIHPNSEASWNNPEFNRVLGQVLDLVAPDVVHLHAIQNFGATAFSQVTDRGIALAVTVHDCWFLCERQFMINHAGRYCHQEKIDLQVCRFCVPDHNQTAKRFDALRQCLNSADLILYPSEFHRKLHVENGISAEKSRVNKNGVKMPKADYARKPNPDPEKHKVRFGFVGGPGPIKGASIMARAMKKLGRKDYELRVVDAATNVGQSWRHDPVWSAVPGTVTFVPAYDHETIDKVFAEIDVLLFPSQWKESFGLTVREAMVRGSWVVASDAGGLIEDCIEGANATIIPMDGDSDKLARVIKTILDNPLPKKMETAHIKSIEDQATELNDYLRELLRDPA